MRIRVTIKAKLQYKGMVEFDYAGVKQKLTFNSALPHKSKYEFYGVEPVWGIVNNLITEIIKDRVMLDKDAPMMAWSDTDNDDLSLYFGSLPSDIANLDALLLGVQEALRKPIAIDYYEYGNVVSVEVRPIIDKISVQEVRLVNED